MKAGNYELIRKIATGSLMELFLSKGPGPGGYERPVAVKRLLPHLAKEPAFVEQFLSEARLASRLSHPHIVEIFEVGRAEGSYYLAMEYLDGPSLRALVRAGQAQGTPLPPELCAWIIAEACEGLAFVHDFGEPVTGRPRELVHGSVSLDTLLVSRQGTVKVGDFGMARVEGQAHRQQAGILPGRLSALSPEQLRGKPVDRRVDVYALGIAFYELLTGHTPFEARTEADGVRAILSGQPVPATQHRPDLPRAVQWILDRALAPDREKRYPDCHALQADLEAFIRVTRNAVGTSQLARYIDRVIGTPPEMSVPAPAPRADWAAARAWDSRGARFTPRLVVASSPPDTQEDEETEPAGCWVSH